MLAAMTANPGKTVGVLGGMGPAATADFMTSVIALTNAAKDQDHVRMIVDNNPQVPDRQQALLGDRAPVESALASMATNLEAAGADFLVMPCNTAHVFINQAIESVSIPFLNIIDETVSALDQSARCIGIMATTGCVNAGVYQAAIEASNRQFLLPDQAEQEQLMQLIFHVKSGDTSEAVRMDMVLLARSLIEAGADAIIGGCTEIPIVLAQTDIDVPFASSNEILARRTIEFAKNNKSQK